MLFFPDQVDARVMSGTRLADHDAIIEKLDKFGNASKSL